ncbi:MAG: ABC transporter ATP-binding protein [Candidatus Omnitrophica bacterium]|nr:ABC transporter ATP-binding protein [Candidatus Omnitrophota bacterium]
MSVLQVHNAVKNFGSLRAVDHVSFSLDQGDNLAIIGESGCGKTTLAKMMMGLVKIDKGLIKAESFSVQMVFQDPYSSLDPLWNVREILKEALWRNRSLSAGQAQEKMEQMLSAVGLSMGVLQRFPHEFSGGERQRIAIARALLCSPKILILDEATSALDTLVQKQIMDLLKKLKQEFNLTYIFISHNLRLVRNFSDKIAVMYQGKIVEEGQAKKVLQSPSHPYTRQLLQASFYINFK